MRAGREGAVREEVVRRVTGKGVSASELVREVSQKTKHSEKDVQKELRVLLNRGDLEVGKELKLFRRRR